jgi:hypothetical protein
MEREREIETKIRQFRETEKHRSRRDEKTKRHKDGDKQGFSEKRPIVTDGYVIILTDIDTEKWRDIVTDSWRDRQTDRLRD